MIKNPPTNTGVIRLIPAPGRFLGEGNGNHSSILAWNTPWTEEPSRLQSIGLQRAGHDLMTQQSLSPPHGSLVKNLPAVSGDVGRIRGLVRSTGEGNGNPLQYICWKSYGQRMLVGSQTTK